MPQGKVTDFQIYDEEFFGGFSEALEQNSDVFNAGSNGTIVLRPNRLKGHFERESFIQNITDLVTRRDITSVASVDDKAMTQDEFVGVKVNRKIGPVAQTLDAWRKIGEDQSTMSFTLGQQIGKAAAVDMANTAILALVGAITDLEADAGAGSAIFDGTAGTPDHANLVDIMAKLGDASGDVACWVMHSKTYFDLMKDGIDKSAEIIQQLAGTTIYTGTTASLGRPVVVSDSPSLKYDDTGDRYRILGLVPGAGMVDESEQQEIVSQLITGNENLGMRVQGEYAYNLKVRGMKWDSGAGGNNPTDAALNTTDNWVSVMATAVNGIKGGPGSMGLFQ